MEQLVPAVLLNFWRSQFLRLEMTLRKLSFIYNTKATKGVLYPDGDHK